MPDSARPAGNAASGLVAALERAWTAIRRRHPQVPEVVMAMASGSVGRRGALTLGHFADRRWRVAAAERPELFVGGEGLAAGDPSNAYPWPVEVYAPCPGCNPVRAEVAKAGQLHLAHDREGHPLGWTDRIPGARR